MSKKAQSGVVRYYFISQRNALNLRQKYLVGE